MPQLIIRKWSIYYASLSAMFNRLQIKAVQSEELLKNIFGIKVATIKILWYSVMQHKPSHATTQSTLSQSQRWIGLKEGLGGKSMKNALYVLPQAKRYLSN